MNRLDHLRDLTGHLRRDDVQVVTVAILGPPTAAIAVARAIASVVPVASMRHTPDQTDRIRLDVSCHVTRGRRP